MPDDSINKTIGTIFMIGFISGAIFNSSGIITFIGGFMTGAIFTKTYWTTELPNITTTQISDFFSSLSSKIIQRV